MENKKIILVVEDEAPLRHALIEKLFHEGFEVLNAKNGEEGLETALLKHPQVILLDILMPKMDGMEVLRKLRADAWGKTAHIIMLTNLNDNERVAEAMKNHAFDYFVKSDVKIQEVVDKIKEKLTN
jgi:DNA-binding response OmpR family regulator